MAAKFKPHCEVKAKERMLSGKKQDDPSEAFHQGRASDEAGQSFGVSGRTVSKAENVLASGCEELEKAMQADRVNVSIAEKLCKKLSGSELAKTVAEAMASASIARSVR